MPARRRSGRGVGGDAREEAVEHQLLGLGARDLVAQRAADELRAAAGDGDGPRRARLVAEQALLGDAAGLHQLLEGVRLELAAAREPRLDATGEREIHVVAAEQQVIADGGALVHAAADRVAALTA